MVVEMEVVALVNYNCCTHYNHMIAVQDCNSNSSGSTTERNYFVDVDVDFDNFDFDSVDIADCSS